MFSTSLKRRARRILDDIRDGMENHSLQAVNWALRILGDTA